MYQIMNNRVYNTDRKKIIFTLSFMKDGVAKMWKQSWWKQHTAENTTFRTWEEFKNTLKRSFTPADKEDDAITKMQTASITGKTADKFIKEFKNWQLQSGVNEDRLLIEWFLTALLTSLRDKILQKENPPTTLEGWYTTTSNLDNQWRKFKAISACLRKDTDTKKKGLRLPQNELWYTPPTYHDPNAMEDVQTIYRMSLEERDRHMKQGLCFRCHQAGYLFQECAQTRPTGSRPIQNMNTPPVASSSSTIPNHPPPANAYARIKAIYKELPDDEKNKLANDLESTGF